MSEPTALPTDPQSDVDAQTAFALLTAGLVDVLDLRVPYEWASGHIEGATLLPLGDLDPDRVAARRPIVAMCRSGNRSGVAACLLRSAGVRAHNMAGGMIAWERVGLPQVPGDETR
jgi:rhodanese-related sulfurtransferase